MGRQLQRERNWSQGKIAQLFSVSQPAVGQWLRATAGQGYPEPGLDGPDDNDVLAAPLHGQGRRREGLPSHDRSARRARVTPWRTPQGGLQGPGQGQERPRQGIPCP